MSACDTCHRRKVRCILSEDNGGCLNCVKAMISCTFTVAEQHRARRRMKRQHPLSVELDTSSTIDTTDDERDGELLPSSPRNQPSNAEASQSSFPASSVPSEEDLAEEGLGRTALYDFHRRSIVASSWNVFENRYMRIAYLGTNSNLLHLVNEEAISNGNANDSLHLPFPPIRSTMPWKPEKHHPLGYSIASIDDMGSLPAKEVRDALVNSFFSDIHPGFPIVDEMEFRSRYVDKVNPPPLLQLQAILLAGAHVCDHPNVARSRPLVKMTLFRRAKALFDLRHENDRMHLVQAALLFTWHFENADDVSANVYYWIGTACRIAFGLGMHRNLGPDVSSRMPLGDRRIFRRIWWNLFLIDAFASLHHGRPLMIDLNEVDQPLLTAEDFVEYCGVLNENVNVEYCIQSIHLCHILVSIIKMSSPGSIRRYSLSSGSFEAAKARLDSELVGWYLRLPESLTTSCKENFNFWTSQLQLHYNLALLQLHRQQQLALVPDVPDVSQDTCHSAALQILNVFEDIQARGCIKQCSFTALTVVLGTAIQLSKQSRAAIENRALVLALQRQRELERLLPIMIAVAEYWPSAEAIYSVFSDILSKLKTRTRRAFENSEIARPVEGIFNINVEASENLFGIGQSNTFLYEDFSDLNEWMDLPASGCQF